MHDTNMSVRTSPSWTDLGCRDLRHDIAKPDKVVHVGHSFGSIVTNALVASHPTLSDGIVLTGFSQNFEWVGQWLVSTVFRLAEDVSRILLLASVRGIFPSILEYQADRHRTFRIASPMQARDM